MFLATSERYFSGYIIFVYFVYFPIVFPTTEIPLYVYTEDVFEFSEAGDFQIFHRNVLQLVNAEV